MEGIPMEEQVKDVQEWAEEQFGRAELGDARRTRRAVAVGAAMAAHPAGSIPDQMGEWKDMKAAYRLFAEEDVTFEALTAPHREATLEAARGRERVLMIQDSTELDYTDHRRASGLGPVGDGRGRGMMLQTVLAVDPAAGQRGSAAVLGLGHQAPWYQRSVPKGETRKQRQALQVKARQWIKAVEAIGQPPEGSRWIHVADREADNFDFFEACQTTGTGFVVRAAQDRRAALGHTAGEAEGYVKTLARSLPPLGTRRLKVRARPNREPGWMELSVSASAITVFAPRLKGGDAQPVRCWVVRVWDPASLGGPEPVEWILLTSEPVEGLEDALQVAEWYSLRWLVEEYHKCLKTGCRVEARQLEEAARLERALGVLAVVAVRLLQLKQQTRLTPDRLAQECVPAEHLRVLALYHRRQAETMTVYEFWRLTARLGGFVARKSDGEPGWQTLWRGWQKLDLMTLGASLASVGGPRCG